MAPEGYFEGEGWWWWEDAHAYMPSQSIFPDERGGPRWGVGDIPANFGGGKRGKSVQGFKLHVCVHPEDFDGLFKLLSPLLRSGRLAHKFAPSDIYSKQRIGHTAFQLIGTKDGDSGAGKACVIYPSSPAVLRDVVRGLDGAIKMTSGIRPFPGGVKGDYRVGSTGFIYCRYGAFQGELARANKIYDPIDNDTCFDPRFVSPLPSFFKCMPSEIRSVSRG
jgi:hypothetical protein